MPGIKGRAYLWSPQWISFEVPSANGVYLVRNKEGAVLHVGKGDLRERLLSHWNRESPADASGQSFPSTQDRGHDARVPAAVDDGHNGQGLPLGRVGDQVVPIV